MRSSGQAWVKKRKRRERQRQRNRVRRGSRKGLLLKVGEKGKQPFAIKEESWEE